MGVFDFKKKKPQTTVLASEPVVASDAKLFAEQREGRAMLIRSIGMIDCMAYENRGINREKLDYYEAILENMKDILEDAEFSEFDTEEVNEIINQFLYEFVNALKNGKEKTANHILEGIVRGIRFKTDPFVFLPEEDLPEEDLAEIHIKRVLYMDCILNEARILNVLDAIELRIDELKPQIFLNQKKRIGKELAKQLERFSNSLN